MVKSKRIEPIVNMAHDSEREAAKALGDALQAYEGSVQQLHQLQQYRQEYHDKLSSSGGVGMNAQSLVEFRSFIAKLGLAIDQQQEAVEQARLALEEKKQFWFGRRGRSKALDKVLDKHLLREQQQQNKREQRELDDYNSRPKSK